MTRDDIRAAHARAAPYVRETPVIDVAGRDLGLATDVNLKLELLQVTGSFKPRGAFNTLLSRDVPKAGVAAASGGNHGAAVAHAATRLGVPARIFVPEIASPAKIARIRATGADLVVGGAAYADALAACEAYCRESGAFSIHAYDADETIAGQGGVALEWERQSPGLDTVLIAVGGGGLISGMASWYGRRVRVVGVEPETSRCLHASLEAGRPVDVPVSGVAADSLGARNCGARVLALAKEHVERVVLVPDAAIREAQTRLWRGLRMVAEPGGAAALAALVAGAYVPAPGERVGVLVCGSNTELKDVPA
jgi:threonine dehydratase